MEYTTEELQSYAAKLIAKGKELRNALNERSRDQARWERHDLSAGYRAEALVKHDEDIQAVLQREALIEREEPAP